MEHKIRNAVVIIDDQLNFCDNIDQWPFNGLKMIGSKASVLNRLRIVAELRTKA